MQKIIFFNENRYLRTSLFILISLTDKRCCSKPLALQEYSFMSSESAVNKLHLECYSVVEYANSDYDGYIRLLVLKRRLLLLISYKLFFDLYFVIM